MSWAMVIHAGSSWFSETYPIRASVGGPRRRESTPSTLADPADGRNISVTDVPLTDDANPQLPIILFPWLAAAALAVCVALAARDKG